MRGKILEILQDPRLALPIETYSGHAISGFENYLELLIKWNFKVNLTAQKSKEEILSKHIFDSLQYYRSIRKGFKVLDIGSGGGFPGIPLKLVLPGLELVMLESQRKRCSFLETVVRELDLDKTTVINDRAELVSDEYNGIFDAVVFRAVTSIESCLVLGQRFLVPRGMIILKKDPQEKPQEDSLNLGLKLKKEIFVSNYQGLVSSLLEYEKCFT